MEFYQKTKQQIMDFWQTKNRDQKIKIIVAIIVIVITVIALLYLISRPKYVPLYSGLDIKDAGDMVKKLEDENIPYKLDEDGKTILVNPEQKYKTRLLLAQDGLPKGGTMGFDDVFNKTRIGTTDWERQIQYNQALQGELSRAIEKMEAVESSKIYIVQQEKSLFIEPDSKNEPSAAVFLELKPGTEMTNEEVYGIINLITYSVKGMKPEYVTVVDQYGRTLSNIPLSAEEDTQEMINNQLVIQNNFQIQLQSSVQSLLEQVFGTGNVAVRVSAQLNFDKKTVENKLFTPVNEETGEGIVRSIQELKEHFSGVGTSAAEGSPGMDSNLGYEQLQGGDSEHQRSETIKNFDINETNENLTVAPGAVNKLSVSVVVNRELSESEKDSIALMVGNAIGYNPERDQVSVEGIEFQNDLAQFFADEIARQQKEKARMRNFTILGMVLAALAAFIVFRRINEQRRRRLEEERLSEEFLEMQQAAATQAQDDVFERNAIYEKVEKHAHRRPEDVAKVLKSWLRED